MRRLRGKWLAIWLLVWAWSGMGSARTFRDDLGRAVRVPEKVQRIVSLAPSATENLFAIEAGELVVGVTSACDYPPQAKKLPQVGDFMKPSLERIAALHPDVLVVVSSTIPKAIADELQAKAKVPVFVLQPRTVQDVLRGLLVLGELTNRKSNAKKLVRRLEQRLQGVKRSIKAGAKPKVVVEIAPPPSLMVAGPGTYIDDAIRWAGGENAFADASQPFPTVSLEALVARDPDVYIVPVKAKRNEQVWEEVRRRSGYNQLRCVREGRVYAIDPDLLFRPTPRLVSGIERLATLLQAIAR
ncbi:MAG: cobalamin-binding protein [Candidatus Fervidibacterota bacterium]